MKENIAKRYVKALLGTLQKEEIDSATQILNTMSLAFLNEKFRMIISSPQADKVKKKELLLDVVQTNDKKIINFINVLIQKERAGLIPVIAKELNLQNSIMQNKFEGDVFSQSAVEDSKLKEIEEGLSKKLGSQITLRNNVCNYPGVKIEIADLNIEVSFSIDRFKAQMAEHILKAI